jgi:hypothetical protein
VFALKHLSRRRRVCMCTYKPVVCAVRREYDACGGKSGGQLAREGCFTCERPPSYIFLFVSFYFFLMVYRLGCNIMQPRVGVCILSVMLLVIFRVCAPRQCTATATVLSAGDYVFRKSVASPVIIPGIISCNHAQS